MVRVLECGIIPSDSCLRAAEMWKEAVRRGIDRDHDD